MLQRKTNWLVELQERVLGKVEQILDAVGGNA
jgi:hypothetical protein